LLDWEAVFLVIWKRAFCSFLAAKLPKNNDFCPGKGLGTLRVLMNSKAQLWPGMAVANNDNNPRVASWEGT
jgi:hypothetical protein